MKYFRYPFSVLFCGNISFDCSLDDLWLCLIFYVFDHLAKWPNNSQWKRSTGKSWWNSVGPSNNFLLPYPYCHLFKLKKDIYNQIATVESRAAAFSIDWVDDLRTEQLLHYLKSIITVNADRIRSSSQDPLPTGWPPSKGGHLY